MYAALQDAASSHYLVELKDGEELKSEPKEKWTFVGNKNWKQKRVEIPLHEVWKKQQQDKKTRQL